MITPRTRSLVSLAAALTLTLALGGCAGAPSRLASDGPAPGDGPPPIVRFDNDSRDYVHVYLVGARREWLLGRVAPAARAALRIPEEAMAEDAGPLRLAVLAGDRVTQRVAFDARAASALARPAAEILSQRWTFSQTLARSELMALPLGRAWTQAGHQ
jgi:hypothetical protein